MRYSASTRSTLCGKDGCGWRPGSPTTGSYLFGATRMLGTSWISAMQRTPTGAQSGRQGKDLPGCSPRLDELEDRLGPDRDLLLDDAVLVDQVADRRREDAVELGDLPAPLA